MIEGLKFSKDMQMLNDIVGVDTTMKIISALGGMSIYVPRPDHPVIRYFHERLGGDTKKTAQYLGVSDRTVRRAIQGQNEADGQMTIFDEINRMQLATNG